MKWTPKTFEHDGFKDTHCTNCGKYLKYNSRLIDKEIKRKKCPDCGTSNIIYPPRKAVVDNKKVILFRDSSKERSPMDCTFTADNSI